MYIKTDRHMYGRNYIVCLMKPVLCSNEETIYKVGKCIYGCLCQMSIQVPCASLSLAFKVRIEMINNK